MYVRIISLSTSYSEVLLWVGYSHTWSSGKRSSDSKLDGQQWISISMTDPITASIESTGWIFVGCSCSDELPCWRCTTGEMLYIGLKWWWLRNRWAMNWSTLLGILLHSRWRTLWGLGWTGKCAIRRRGLRWWRGVAEIGRCKGTWLLWRRWESWIELDAYFSL